MRDLKNKPFQRDLEDHGLENDDLREVLDDIFDGRAAPLGSKIYKIRGAQEGKGKRGGFRSLFFWKQDELIIFCVLFAKNERDNLAWDEKKALKILSEEYDKLTEHEIQERIKKKTFAEIEYVKKSKP